jgi:hypothetical protein
MDLGESLLRFTAVLAGPLFLVADTQDEIFHPFAVTIEIP